MAVGTCVTVQAVAMSVLFADPDDRVTLNDGGRQARKGIYISERGLSTTAPRSGIALLADPSQPDPVFNPGDALVVTGEYVENFGVSEIRLTSACGLVVGAGTLAVPAPAVVTLSSVGQSGGSTGCPETGAPWVDGASAEDFEGVLVKVVSGTVATGRDGFGNLELTDGTGTLVVSAVFPGVAVSPNVGDTIDTAGVTGFGHFSLCRRKLRPRSDSEATFVAPPASCGSAPKADHLLITEVKLGPTSGEFVEIHNPTNATITLDNYHLWSATVAPAGSAPGEFYDSWPAVQTSGMTGGDFVLRFPSAAAISPGEYQVVSLGSAAGYCLTFGCSSPGLRPNYEIPPPAGCAATDDPAVPNMLGNWDPAQANACNIGVLGGFGYLNSPITGEDLVLFKWSSGEALVKDVDYVVWGPFVHTSKTGIGTYLPDTPVANQATLQGSPSNSQSYQRVCMNEGTQVRTGGNGITGGDETSENLGQTFVVANSTPKAASAGAAP